MTKSDPLSTITTRTTPQSERADARQVKNSAGGFVFPADTGTRLQRFLTIGTTGGTYYTSERDLTRANADLVLQAARANGAELADRAREISVAGRAPRQNPALFALAAVSGLGDDEARGRALGYLPEVARTGSTLFTFARYVEQFRGHGRALNRALAAWYQDKDPERLAYQLVKYRQRDGWSHRDILRLAKPKAADLAHDALYGWATNSAQMTDAKAEALPELVHGFELAQRATTAVAWAALVHRYGLSWEMLPDAALTEPSVWRALVQTGMPQTALLRQLPRLTRLGVLADSETRALVTIQLADAERLKRARVHPVNVLVAAKTYAAGRGKGSTWTPNRAVTDALDAAFYAAFPAVEPAGKRTLVALDVSGSMSGGTAGGTPLSPREASSALALVQLATEPNVDIVGFTGRGWSSPRAGGRSWLGDGIEELDISPRRRLDDVVRYTERLPMGATDCALPMLWAKAQGRDYDTFVIYTDNETWHGGVHPHQALTAYRNARVPNARLVVVGMTANDVTIADPSDPGQLDVAGFDSAVPRLIADHSAGRL